MGIVKLSAMLVIVFFHQCEFFELMLSSYEHSTAKYAGKIINPRDSAGLGDVFVVLGEVHTKSDTLFDTGSFHFNDVPTGPTHLRLERPGYFTIDTTVSVSVNPSATGPDTFYMPHMPAGIDTFYVIPTITNARDDTVRIVYATHDSARIITSGSVDFGNTHKTNLGSRTRRLSGSLKIVYVNHTGSTNIRLFLVDAWGDTIEDSISVFIHPNRRPKIIDFQFENDGNFFNNQSHFLQFDTIVDLDTNFKQIEVDWGDTTPVVIAYPLRPAGPPSPYYFFGQVLRHTYSIGNDTTFIVTIRAIDKNNAVTTFTPEILVRNREPPVLVQTPYLDPPILRSADTSVTIGVRVRWVQGHVSRINWFVYSDASMKTVIEGHQTPTLSKSEGTIPQSDFEAGKLFAHTFPASPFGPNNYVRILVHDNFGSFAEITGAFQKSP